jgi:predicted TIM-barrel fold metal-dependent hydrolase
LIVDSHQHVGNLVDALAYDGTDPSADPDLETDIRRRLQVMDSLGIDKVVLQPSHGYLRTDGLAATMRINDQMRCYLDCPGDPFCVFGTTEPMFGQAAVGEVERIAEIGLRGVAWHHRFQGCFIDSRWMWPILERMSDLDLVPLLHVNAESSMEAPWRLQRLAIDFPHLTFLAMDGLWSYERARQAQAIAGLTPNIIWDMGGPVCYISPTEWVRENGSGTLCFSANYQYGTNGPVTKPTLLSQLESAPISDLDRRKILGGNLVQALGLGDQTSTPPK